MGECGCVSCGETYKLPGPNGITYLITLLPACNYCDVGPAIEIRRVPKKADYFYKDSIEFAGKLPVSHEMDDISVSIIYAGPSESALKKAAKECAYEGCDEISAEILAEGMYEVLPLSPKIIE